MTVPIYSDKNLNIGHSNTGVKKQTSFVSKTTPVVELKQSKQITDSSENASIQISQEAKILHSYLNENESNSVNWNKVNQIKQQLELGTYKINNLQVAEKIINLENKLS